SAKILNVRPDEIQAGIDAISVATLPDIFKGDPDSLLINEALYFPQVHDTSIYVPYNQNFSKESDKFNKAVRIINKRGIDNWYKKYYGK
ncbi:hypothetical protein CIN01S_27_00020, partial [Chryseobacterium indologenes NBRC 14944]